MKPLPTLMRPLRSVDLESGEAGEALVERSDVAAVEALAVVAEAAVAFELARAAREKFGGDSLGDFVGRLARVPGADPVAHALDRHVALIGFMGAGKSTLGAEAARAARPPLPRPRSRAREVDAGSSLPWAVRGAGRGRVPSARGGEDTRGAERRVAGGALARGRGGRRASRSAPRCGSAP